MGVPRHQASSPVVPRTTATLWGVIDQLNLGSTGGVRPLVGIEARRRPTVHAGRRTGARDTSRCRSTLSAEVAHPVDRLDASLLESRDAEVVPKATGPDVLRKFPVATIALGNETMSGKTALRYIPGIPSMMKALPAITTTRSRKTTNAKVVRRLTPGCVTLYAPQSAKVALPVR